MLFSSDFRRKRPTKIEQLRMLLSDGDWHTTNELVRCIGHTFGVAIFHLRRMHKQIVCQLQPGSSHQYRYRLVPTH
jgi:hypothetical protein